MFPKKGNNFPNGSRRPSGSADYARAIATALRAELGDSHQATKTVIRWTGVNERTAKNWLAGTRGPRGEHLVYLAGHSEKVLDVFLRLAGREQALAAKRVIDARNILAETVHQLDLLTIDGNGREPAAR